MKPAEHDALRGLLEGYKETYTHLTAFLHSGEAWMRRCRSLFRVIRMRGPAFIKTTRLMAESLATLRELNADLMLRRYEQLGHAEQVLVHMARVSILLRDLEQEVFLLAKSAAQDSELDEVLMKKVSLQVDILEDYARHVERLSTIEKALKHLLHHPVDIDEDEEDKDK